MSSNTALIGSESMIVGLPAAGTSAVYKLDPGSYTQFMFKLDQVTDVALRPDGALEMKLDNGSSLTIQNFQELANSAESCGRDTIFQMLEDKTGAGGEKFTSIMNISPDGLLKTLDPTLFDDKSVTLNEPSTGMTKEVMIEPGQTYKINFDWQDAAKTVDGNNLMLSFKNGGLLILRDFVPAMNDNLPPAMTLADGTVIDPGTLVVAACSPAETGAAMAATHAPQSELRAPDIEPGAGDVTKQAAPAKTTQADTAALDLANIEPAAGGGNSPASGGRGGAGFASGIDAANLNGLNALGPIAPTSLIYGIPRVEDSPVSGLSFNQALPPALQNPPAPILEVRNEQLFEDTNVTLSVSTAALPGTTTTVVISGIPATWTVDAGLGTYDALAGEWRIVLPPGSTFSGGPQLTPPNNADGDILALDVSAVAADITTGRTSVSTASIVVQTDAVADMPNLNANTFVSVEQDLVAALNITSSLNDTDGSEVLSIKIEGLPEGATLSAGTLQPDGSYLLTSAQLAGLKVIPAAGYVGSSTLLVTATATETNFSGAEFNFTNNIASRSANIVVSFTRDDVPVLTNAIASVDETGLPSVTVSGSVNPSFGHDTGTVAPEGVGSFGSAGSLLGGTLASNGVPVVVSLVGDTYTGTANGTPVFKLVVNTNGTYTFTQFDNLDHADGSNANDVIQLTFGVVATDNEGDATKGTITINVRDDAPIAYNDTVSEIKGQASGNVMLNDVAGQDNPAVVTSVSVGGTVYAVSLSGGSTTIPGLYGVLVIASTGQYTYTAHTDTNGTDYFRYTIVDGDGDKSSAVLHVLLTDGTPTIGDSTVSVDETNLGPIVLNGTYSFNYGADGAGSISAQGQDSFKATGSLLGGTLASNGVPVVVSLVGDTYTGTANGTPVFKLVVNTNGTYTFTQFDNLDHADGSNANDGITLNFGIQISDADGDKDTGVIAVVVKDDAPIAYNDTVSEIKGQASGNVMLNDVAGQDNPAVVTSVSVGGTVYAVSLSGGSTTIPGLYGVLVIASTGQYTYTAQDNKNGTDAFRYTIVDGDGDKSSATLSVIVTDGAPTIGDASVSVDETNLGPIVLNGTYSFNYGADGAGSISLGAASTFMATGSLLCDHLTHNGVPVVVSLVGDTYIGKAGAVDVFSMTIRNNGTYVFTLKDNLDHADDLNPNDVIHLSFKTSISDADGDTDTGVITVNIVDDAPVAHNDGAAVVKNYASGNVLTNDVSTESPHVTQVVVNGYFHDVAEYGRTKIYGQFGTLWISQNGDYTYEQTANAPYGSDPYSKDHTGEDRFTYVVTDADHDYDMAVLSITTQQGTVYSSISSMSLVDLEGGIDPLLNLSNGALSDPVLIAPVLVENVIEVQDDVSKAIDEFVCQTCVVDNDVSKSVPEDRPISTVVAESVMTPLDDQQLQYQQAVT